MEEEDDDLYGPSEGPAEDKGKAKSEEADESGDDEPMLESGEEEESSDSDIDIIIDKPATAPKTAVSERQESKAIKIEAPPKQTSAPPQAAAGTVPQLPSQPGTAYPPVRSSTIDVNADPVYPAVGKPISQIDMDADLAESMKPWRLPGADQSDYFNYGFDEFTWEMYRQRQSNIAATLAQQKAETAQFQQMFMPSMSGPAASSGTAGGNSGGSGGAGGVPGAPTGPAAQGGGGMGDMAGMMGMSQEQLMGLMTQMQASGIDPAQMDFPTFMQMAGGMGAGFPGAQQGGAGFGGGGGQQQPGGGGRGQGGRRGGRGW
ncbi:hypothetical protein CC78DRAFT_565259 [Lojkania enalia]|uniref:Pre-mRNA polyadenylation factor Fip1 domain-containing protein n=1 Tax=Lojkania enalia TaxID=147567 RepID=A0A9P4KGP7_9PLEO|nr:hypothetical protein CC78DRAFT_565259 [Didymosphaeria enalia]